MKRLLSSFFVFWIIYLLLTSFEVEEVLIGGLVSIVLASIVYKVTAYNFNFSVIYKLLFFVILYIPVFVWNMLIANLDIARRVLSPKVPVNPGIVKVPTSLKTDMGKLTLANSVTLTPGTLSIDADENNLYIHWVDVKGKQAQDYKANVYGRMENILEVIFK